MAIKPEDILADNADTIQLNGIKARKGTIAAALANADILSSTTSTPEEKQAAREMIQELAPALIAVGMHKHVIWKNAEIQQIIERVKSL